MAIDQVDFHSRRDKLDFSTGLQVALLSNDTHSKWGLACY